MSIDNMLIDQKKKKGRPLLYIVPEKFAILCKHFHFCLIDYRKKSVKNNQKIFEKELNKLVKDFLVDIKNIPERERERKNIN